MADPTVELRNRALFLSELSFEEAFELDNINLSKKIGEFNIIRIGEIFSSRLYKDPDDNFRSLFSSKLEEDHALDFSDYLLQRLGGKNDYSKSKGPPLLPARHINLNISIDSARRWYGHMQDTLEELDEDIDINLRRILLNFLKYTAYYLVACNEVKIEMVSSKTYDHPMNSRYEIKNNLP